MKAAIYRQYGPPEVVKIAEVPIPAPRRGEVRIRVLATTVTTADWRLRSSKAPSRLFWLMVRLVIGIFSPRKAILGTEGTGVVDAVGDQVTRFKPGDAVIFATGIGLGAHAEYICLSEKAAIVSKAKELDDASAAALCFGGLTALQYLRDLARLKPGEHVLVTGASGAVGSAAVQIAKALGARVTALGSTRNLELIRSLGADHVVDYTQGYAFAESTFDVVLDCVGILDFASHRTWLKPGGRFLAVLVTTKVLLQSLASRVSRSSQKLLFGVSLENPTDMNVLQQLAVAKKYTVVIRDIFPFEDIVKAHRLVDSGHKVGNVVITLCGLEAGDTQ